MQNTPISLTSLLNLSSATSSQKEKDLRFEEISKNIALTRHKLFSNKKTDQNGLNSNVYLSKSQIPKNHKGGTFQRLDVEDRYKIKDEKPLSTSSKSRLEAEMNISKKDAMSEGPRSQKDQQNRNSNLINVYEHIGASFSQGRLKKGNFVSGGGGNQTSEERIKTGLGSSVTSSNLFHGKKSSLALSIGNKLVASPSRVSLHSHLKQSKIGALQERSSSTFGKPFVNPNYYQREKSQLSSTFNKISSSWINRNEGIRFEENAQNSSEKRVEANSQIMKKSSTFSVKFLNNFEQEPPKNTKISSEFNRNVFTTLSVDSGSSPLFSSETPTIRQSISEKDRLLDLLNSTKEKLNETRTRLKIESSINNLSKQDLQPKVEDPAETNGSFKRLSAKQCPSVISLKTITNPFSNSQFRNAFSKPSFSETTFFQKVINKEYKSEVKERNFELFIEDVKEQLKIKEAIDQFRRASDRKSITLPLSVHKRCLFFDLDETLVRTELRDQFKSYNEIVTIQTIDGRSEVD